jgi:DNA-binding NtrC family response regulator
MIFLVEDEPTLRGTIAEYLTTQGLEVEAFGDAESALEAAKGETPDVVVTDVQLPGASGVVLVGELGKLDNSVVRIVMTAHSSVQTAIAAMRAGAWEFVEKPVDLPRLSRMVLRALEERRSKTELAWLRGQSSSFVGESAAFKALVQKMDALKGLGTEAPPVFIHGETGSGKGVVAKALHSLRFGEGAPFIEVNCAALPATLVEAELFGYEKSAFTDAKAAKPGLFEVATGGTLFLDEVGELALEVQAKLLKIIESKTLRRLGAVKDREVNTAVVAASNVDLFKAAEEKRFRRDLYHRLAALTLKVPSLRERPGDAVLLARAFLKESCARYKKTIASLSPGLEEAINQHDWPGNVRELKFAIERAVLLAPKDCARLESLEELEAKASSVMASGAGATIAAGPSGVEVTLPADGVAFDTLELAILKKALELAQGNVSQASKLLQVSRDTLRYRMRKYGLDTHTDAG